MELNLDENSSVDDNSFRETHSNHVSSLTELPSNTIGTESEKSELNGDHWSPETFEHSDDPNCQLPSDLVKLELQPQRMS